MPRKVNFEIDPLATGHYRVWFSDRHGKQFGRVWVMTECEMMSLCDRLCEEEMEEVAERIFELMVLGGYVSSRL